MDGNGVMLEEVPATVGSEVAGAVSVLPKVLPTPRKGMRRFAGFAGS